MTAAIPAARLHPRKSTPRMLALSAVVLGHLWVLLIVWQEKFSHAQPGEARRMLTLRLIPPPSRPQVSPAAEPREAARRALPARAAAPQPSAPPEDTRSIVLPATPGEPGPSDGGPSTGAHAAVPSGGAASGPARLSLQPSREVLRGALVNPATDDPRSNSPRPTFEERIAMGLDPDICIKLERLPDGTVRRTLSRLVNAETLLQQTQGVGAKGARVCR